MIIEEFIVLLAIYLVPMYIANATPIILHGKKPVDFGKKINGKRILGDGKTILGALFGIIVGTIAGFILYYLLSPIFALPNPLLLALLLSAGAIIGDMAKSFFKRRLGFESGARLPVFDQIDFIIGGLIFSLVIRFPEIEVVIFLLVATVFIHTITNLIAYKLKLKKVPW